MLKVRNLGSKFCSITGGILDHGEIKTLDAWEVRMLIRMGTYDLQIILDDRGLTK